MKVCPVCNETFPEDMKFCDLDGTRLARQAESTGAPAHHRRWSWLGIALLIGALALSAISVFMIPRSRSLQSPYTPTSNPSVASTSKPTDSGSTSNTTSGMSSATNDSPEIIIASDAPPVDPTAKKKEKTKPTTTDENAPKLDPKAAAQTADDSAKTEPTPPPAPAPKRVEPAPAPKPVNETREPEAAPKPAAAPAAQKDQKRQVAKDDKKRNDEQKKGGFFKVFKKIFGKD